MASRRIRKNIHLSFIFHNFFVLGGVSISIQKGTTRHLLLQYINLKKMSSDSHFYQFSFSYSLFLRITFAKLSILLKLESEKITLHLLGETSLYQISLGTIPKSRSNKTKDFKINPFFQNKI